jgi:hypothetical protein
MQGSGEVHAKEKAEETSQYGFNIKYVLQQIRKEMHHLSTREASEAPANLCEVSGGGRAHQGNEN